MYSQNINIQIVAPTFVGDICRTLCIYRNAKICATSSVAQNVDAFAIPKSNIPVISTGKLLAARGTHMCRPKC